jgi:cytochrome c
MAYKIAIACLVVCLPGLAEAGPLHDAAKAGDVVQIQLLLDQGADINESSGTAPPLYFAINLQHAEAAELLIERGADVNARSTWGMPLHAAATKGMATIATLLLEHGADPNAVCAGKKAPFII